MKKANYDKFPPHVREFIRKEVYSVYVREINKLIDKLNPTDDELLILAYDEICHQRCKELLKISENKYYECFNGCMAELGRLLSNK